jgi:hypothetical protein
MPAAGPRVSLSVLAASSGSVANGVALAARGGNRSANGVDRPQRSWECKPRNVGGREARDLVSAHLRGVSAGGL